VWLACILLVENLETGRIEADGLPLTSEEIADQAAVSTVETRLALDYFIERQMVGQDEDGCYVVLNYLEHQVHRTSIARAKGENSPSASASASASSKGKGKRKTKLETDYVVEALGTGFNEFWEDYPRKVAKQAAAEVWLRMSDEQRTLARSAILVHASNWAIEDRSLDKIPYPATWLNGKSWQDELPGSEAADDDWIFDTYRKDDFERFSGHDMWRTYTDWATYEPPRSAPPFEEWLEKEK
jgi:hypothetical protein